MAVDPKNLFCTLPGGVQNKIFSYLTPENRQEIRRVCFSWKSLIEANFFVRISLTNHSCHYAYQIRNAISAKATNFTLDVFEPIAFKETLRSIHFTHIVISYNLIYILTECKNLEMLAFTHITLDRDRRMKCPGKLQLPNLALIQINFKENHQPTTNELILIDFLSQIKFGNLMSIITTSTPWALAGLGDLGVLMDVEPPFNCLPPPILPTTIKSTAFLELVVNNANTLKRLLIHGKDFRVFGKQIENFGKTLENIQLEEFSYNFKNSCACCSGQECHLVEVQRNLRKLCVQIHTDAWPAISKGITESAATLEDLLIVFKPRALLGAFTFDPPLPFTKFDMSILKNCVKLQSIKLTGPRRIPAENFNCLPTSLRYLSILGPQSNDDLFIAANTLTKLETFILIFNDSEQCELFSLELFKTFMRIKTLKCLCLGHCKIDISDISEFCESRNGLEIVFDLSNVPNEAANLLGNLECYVHNTFNHDDF